MRYYFKIEGIKCLETCPLKRKKGLSIIHIGSSSCSECDNCKKLSEEEDWIICTEITKKYRNKKFERILK